jgi:serine-type D-Ala-D-Ala carboxypeptidase (penicillin-binding protein 5/6)
MVRMMWNFLQTPLGERNTGYLITMGIMAGIAGAFLFFQQSIETKIDILQREALQEQRDMQNAIIEARVDQHVADLHAESIVVYDIEQGKSVFEKNPHTIHGFASLTKLMTFRVVEELLDPTMVMTLDASDMVPGHPIGLQVGDTWSVADWLSLLIMASSNEVATMFARYDDNFIQHMNAYAQSLGMNDTVFMNPTGLDNEGMREAMGSAYDLTLLVRDIMDRHPQGLPVLTQPTLTLHRHDGTSFMVEHTHQGIQYIDNLLLSKTGYTNEAGGALLVVVRPRPGYTYSVIILGSTYEDRFDDIALITDIINSI